MTVHKHALATVLAVVALSITLQSAALGQNGEPCWDCDVDLKLEPGEDSHDWVFTWPAEQYADFDATVTETSRPLVLDAIINPECRSRYELEVAEESAGQLVGGHVGPRYRQVLADPRPHDFEVAVVEVDPPGSGPDIAQCEVTVRLFRPANMCMMSAQVTGEVAGRYFGDIAYFNFFPEGAPITTGNAMDPATAQLVDQLPGMGAGEWDKAMREWAAEDDDPPATVGDKFGLSITDVKQGSSGLAGAPNPYASEFPDSPAGRLESLEATMNALSAFSLTVSAPGDELTDVPAADGKAWPGSITVQPSRVDLMPGNVKDANFEGVKYMWEKGGLGSAPALIVTSESPNVLVGVLKGELFRARPYQRGRLEGSVRVEVTFVARRGALSCMR
jgi:hypothetical protein